jgi:hypothetical protein
MEIFWNEEEKFWESKEEREKRITMKINDEMMKSQEEFDEIKKYRIRSQDFETGLSRHERYIINKIQSERIQKMDELSQADENKNSEKLDDI